MFLLWITFLHLQDQCAITLCDPYSVSDGATQKKTNPIAQDAGVACSSIVCSEKDV